MKYVDEYGKEYATLDDAIREDCRWEDYCSQCKIGVVLCRSNRTESNKKMIMKILGLREV